MSTTLQQPNDHPLLGSARLRESPAPVASTRAASLIEAAVLLGFFLFYLLSFAPTSAVNGPAEIFGQDSVYLLKYLDQGRPYRWNPQSHLLHHVVVEQGYRLWRAWTGARAGMESTYRYLKLFTALCGLGFLATMSWLFRELRLASGARTILLLLTGFSLSAWFHFAAFETHSLALPMVGLYLVALARLRDRATRSLGDRLLLIAALVLCGLVRVDLFRFAATSALLVFLPSVKRWWRSLLLDLLVVGLLGVAGSTLLAKVYFDQMHHQTPANALQRNDSKKLRDRLWQISNLAPASLWTVGRAVSIYSLLMPVEPRPTDRGISILPSFQYDPGHRDRPMSHATELFLQPMTNLADYALPLVTLTGLLIAFGWSLARTARRIGSLDPFHTLLAAQLIGGWLFYTLFNPFEPFLWIAEFMPLWIALLADSSRGQDRHHWLALAALAVLVATHNTFAFYLPFR